MTKYNIETNTELPRLTPEQIKEHADNALLNGVGLAIAHAGTQRVNELCELLNVPADRSNILGSAQNILALFHAMHVRMDLNTDNTFTVLLEFEVGHGQCDGCHIGETLQ